MSNSVKAHRLSDGRLIVEQPDGTFRPAEDKTDWERIKRLMDEEIEALAAEDSDAPLTDNSFWDDAALELPQPKKYIHAGFDADIVEFFKSQGRGYQTRMNAVLRRYMDMQKQAD